VRLGPGVLTRKLKMPSQDDVTKADVNRSIVPRLLDTRPYSYTMKVVAVRVCVASKGGVNKRTWLPASITDERFSAPHADFATK
jgi:hypothetical protein